MRPQLLVAVVLLFLAVDPSLGGVANARTMAARGQTGRLLQARSKVAHSVPPNELGGATWHVIGQDTRNYVAFTPSDNAPVEIEIGEVGGVRVYPNVSSYPLNITVDGVRHKIAYGGFVDVSLGPSARVEVIMTLPTQSQGPLIRTIIFSTRNACAMPNLAQFPHTVAGTCPTTTNTPSGTHVLPHNSSCVVRCAPGHRPTSGSGEVTCMYGFATVPTLQCEPGLRPSLWCDVPMPPAHLNPNIESTTCPIGRYSLPLNQRCSFSCLPGTSNPNGTHASAACFEKPNGEVALKWALGYGTFREVDVQAEAVLACSAVRCDVGDLFENVPGVVHGTCAAGRVMAPGEECIAQCAAGYTGTGLEMGIACKYNNITGVTAAEWRLRNGATIVQGLPECRPSPCDLTGFLGTLEGHLYRGNCPDSLDSGETCWLGCAPGTRASGDFRVSCSAGVFTVAGDHPTCKAHKVLVRITPTNHNANATTNTTIIGVDPTHIQSAVTQLLDLEPHQGLHAERVSAGVFGVEVGLPALMGERVMYGEGTKHAEFLAALQALEGSYTGYSMEGTPCNMAPSAQLYYFDTSPTGPPSTCDATESSGAMCKLGCRSVSDGVLLPTGHLEGSKCIGGTFVTATYCQKLCADPSTCTAQSITIPPCPYCTATYNFRVKLFLAPQSPAEPVSAATHIRQTVSNILDIPMSQTVVTVFNEQPHKLVFTLSVAETSDWFSAGFTPTQDAADWSSYDQDLVTRIIDAANATGRVLNESFTATIAPADCTGTPNILDEGTNATACGPLRHGQSCELQCNEGYTPVGQASVHCHAGLLSPTMLRCSKRPCATASIPTIRHAAMFGGNCGNVPTWAHAYTCQAQCQSGYHIVGDPTVTCNDGDVEVDFKCKAPSVILNYPATYNCYRNDTCTATQCVAATATSIRTRVQTGVDSMMGPVASLQADLACNSGTEVELFLLGTDLRLAVRVLRSLMNFIPRPANSTSALALISRRMGPSSNNLNLLEAPPAFDLADAVGTEVTPNANPPVVTMTGPACDRPIIPEHGTTGNCPEQLAHGETCMLGCDADFVAFGDATVTCANGFIDPPLAMMCRRPPCTPMAPGQLPTGVVPSVDIAHACGHNMISGSTCLVECAPGYKSTLTVGGDLQFSAVATCSSGLMTTPLQCAQQQCTVTIPATSAYTGVTAGTCTLHTPSLNHGQSCDLSCAPGYTLAGSPTVSCVINPWAPTVDGHQVLTPTTIACVPLASSSAGVKTNICRHPPEVSKGQLVSDYVNFYDGMDLGPAIQCRQFYVLSDVVAARKCVCPDNMGTCLPLNSACVMGIWSPDRQLDFLTQRGDPPLGYQFSTNGFGSIAMMVWFFTLLSWVYSSLFLGAIVMSLDEGRVSYYGVFAILYQFIYTALIHIFGIDKDAQNRCYQRRKMFNWVVLTATGLLLSAQELKQDIARRKDETRQDEQRQIDEMKAGFGEFAKGLVTPSTWLLVFSALLILAMYWVTTANCSTSGLMVEGTMVQE